MKRTLCVLLLVLQCALLFSAPSNEKAPSHDIIAGESIRQTMLQKAQDVEISQTTVMFTDASGQRLCVEKTPQSVCILFPSLATLWYEAGGVASMVIGGEAYQQQYITYIGRDITQDSGMAIAASAPNAKKWDIETILAGKPDLIICSTSMYGYATISSPAKVAGIPVIAVDYNDFSDYLKWFRVFSAITGCEELWESIALKALDEVVSILEKCPKDRNPSVFCMFSSSTGLDANTSNTVIGDMICSMNASNITDKWENRSQASRLAINLETVYASEPDMILIQCHAGTDVAQSALEMQFSDNAVWNAIAAVREGKVFFLDRDLFHNKPNRRFAEAYRLLASLIYPDIEF